jgi:hypothetical protein
MLSRRLLSSAMTDVPERTPGEAPTCEKCRKPMWLKVRAPALSEPRMILIYHCPDCETLAFIPAPVNNT